MVSLTDLVDGWNTFFHTPSSPVTIGLFRIVWSCLLFVNGFLLLRNVPDHFGPMGYLTAERYRKVYGYSRLTLFNWLPETNAAAYGVIGIHLTACVMLGLGIGTRWSAIVVWLTLVSLHHRNPVIFHSGDTMLRLMSFLLIFSRAGQSYSVDSQYFNAAETTDGPAFGSPWCERVMQIQVSIVYLRTVFWKLRGKRWLAGTAAYYPTQLETFQRLRIPRWLLNNRLIRLATWGTLLVETSLGTIVWIRECRYPVLLAGIFLHLTLELFLNLQLFGWTMIVCLILFVDPNHVQQLVSG